MTEKCIVAMLLACAGLLSLEAFAISIHQWVDADGVTHFSDTPPAAATPEVTVIELDAQYGTPAVAEDYYSIVNQWQRMRDERNESDQLRLQRDRLRTEAAAVQVVPVSAPSRYSGYGYYPSYGRSYGGSYRGYSARGYGYRAFPNQGFGGYTGRFGGGSHHGNHRGFRGGVGGRGQVRTSVGSRR